jgi:hypothetical protein
MASPTFLTGSAPSPLASCPWALCRRQHQSLPPPLRPSAAACTPNCPKAPHGPMTPMSCILSSPLEQRMTHKNSRPPRHPNTRLIRRAAPQSKPECWTAGKNWESRGWNRQQLQPKDRLISSPPTVAPNAQAPRRFLVRLEAGNQALQTAHLRELQPNRESPSLGQVVQTVTRKGYLA